jgi:hypothetical protein
MPASDLGIGTPVTKQRGERFAAERDGYEHSAFGTLDDVCMPWKESWISPTRLREEWSEPSMSDLA